MSYMFMLHTALSVIIYKSRNDAMVLKYISSFLFRHFKIKEPEIPLHSTEIDRVELERFGSCFLQLALNLRD